MDVHTTTDGVWLLTINTMCSCENAPMNVVLLGAPDNRTNKGGGTMWARIAEWVIPARHFSNIGRVHWRIQDDIGQRAALVQIACSMEISPQLIGDGWDTWTGPKHTWKRWPSFDDIIMQDLMAAYKVTLLKYQDQLRGIFSPGPESASPSVSWQVPQDVDRPEGR